MTLKKKLLFLALATIFLLFNSNLQFNLGIKALAPPLLESRLQQHKHSHYSLVMISLHFVIGSGTQVKCEHFHKSWKSFIIMQQLAAITSSNDFLIIMKFEDGAIQKNVQLLKVDGFQSLDSKQSKKLPRIRFGLCYLPHHHLVTTSKSLIVKMMMWRSTAKRGISTHPFHPSSI